jgi:hypothetical protein
MAETYNGPMASQAGYSDEELADVLSYVREHLNQSGTIWRGSVRGVREKYKERKEYWTMEGTGERTSSSKKVKGSGKNSLPLVKHSPTKFRMV